MPMLTAHLYNFGYTKEQVGFIYGIFGVSRTVTMLVWGRVTDVVGSYRVLFLAEVFGAIGTLIVARPVSVLHAILGITFIGLSVAAWIPSYNKFVAEIVPPQRYGEAYTTTNAYRSLVGVPTPYVGGYLYDSIGVLPLFSVSSLTILTAGVLFLSVGSREAEKGDSRKIC
jgi:DHA1 family multidrug resistance protein-like MFS transporter